MDIGETIKNNLKNKLVPEIGRLIKHFPYQANDDLSIILKGHLLIEDLLVRYVKKKLKNPDKLGNFKFYHFLCLAKALEDKTENNWIWDACEKLNNIRNKLAHHLEHTAIDNLKKDIITIIKKETPEFPKELITTYGELKLYLTALYIDLAFELHLDEVLI